MIYDFLDFVKNHPILFILSILILLFPIPMSMSEWNVHPKRIICFPMDNTCKMDVYSYKQEICWGWLLQSRHSHRVCQLPKYKSSEMQLLPLEEIQDVIVIEESKFYKLYLTGKDDKKAYIAQFKDGEHAAYIASHLRVRIKKWQETPVSDNEMEEYYSFDFSE